MIGDQVRDWGLGARGRGGGVRHTPSTLDALRATKSLPGRILFCSGFDRHRATRVADLRGGARISALGAHESRICAEGARIRPFGHTGRGSPAEGRGSAAWSHESRICAEGARIGPLGHTSRGSPRRRGSAAWSHESRICAEGRGSGRLVTCRNGQHRARAPVVLSRGREGRAGTGRPRPASTGRTSTSLSAPLGKSKGRESRLRSYSRYARRRGQYGCVWTTDVRRTYAPVCRLTIRDWRVGSIRMSGLNTNHLTRLDGLDRGQRRWNEGKQVLERVAVGAKHDHA